MAFVYSTQQNDTKHGNINLYVNIFRGECTRTEKSVSFDFGVSFTASNTPGNGTWTSNSVAAWYGGVQKFAQASSGNIHTKGVGYYYYATYSDRKKEQHNTTEVTCFTYSVNNITATTKSVNVTIGVGWADWAGTNKGNLTFSLDIPEFHGAVGTPDVWITDNGNNTFTVGGTNGANGVNNTATTTYGWGYGDYSNTGTVTDQKLTVPAGTTPAYRSVTAQAITTGAHGSSKSKTVAKNVLYYCKPSQVGKPVISYNKTRLTIKENWSYSWTAATEANKSSPIIGHRIKVYKNGTQIAGLKNSGSGTTISKGTGSNQYLDRATTDTQIVFNPSTLGFKPDDKVKVSIQAYTKYGTGTNLLGDANTSEELIVRNAGVMRVRVDGKLQEGIVKVWTGGSKGSWQEADIVKYKTSSGWKESE